MSILHDISNIINKVADYKAINKYSKVKLRNKVNGIDPKLAILYRLLYSNKTTTKEEAASLISTMLTKINETTNGIDKDQWFDDSDENDSTIKINRQALDFKEKNIPLETYKQIWMEIDHYYNTKTNPKKQDVCVAVDGTYNQDLKHKLVLNIGIYDITNGIPIDITYDGHNQNGEVNRFIRYLKNNKSKFQNAIFVCDRLYHNFELIDFLQSNGFRFIIRKKGDANTLDPNVPLVKSNKKYDLLERIRKQIRIVKCEGEFIKTVSVRRKLVKRKTNKIITNKPEKYVLTIKNDWTLITNIIDDQKYSDEYLKNIYHSRWDIEVFFKFIKRNLKFEHINQKYVEQIKKQYICDLIVIQMLKLVEYEYLKYFNKKGRRKNVGEIKNVGKIKKKNGIVVDVTEKVNLSHLKTGFFKEIICDLVNGTIKNADIKRFYSTNVEFSKNEMNRSYPRVSMIPFTKWYVKGYSEKSKYSKIVNALLDGDISGLDKNLKMIAKRIKTINGKAIKFKWSKLRGKKCI